MRKSKLFLVLISAVVTACAGTEPGVARSQPVDVTAWTGEMPIAVPWLREQLPPGVLTYERIPNVLGLLAIPKGNVFDTALRSDANIRNLIAIQQGLAGNPGVSLPPARLLENLRSPIEIAVVAAPAPSALIAMTLRFRSNADFEAFVAELGQSLPVALAGPLDADGFGQLVGAPLPIFVHFDAATGRLALYGGMASSRPAFQSLLMPPADNVAQPMQALEAQIDSSGQGLFAWVDVAQALRLGAMFMPPETLQAVTASGAGQIRAIAVGAGVADGKGRLKLLADVGTGQANRPLPIVSNIITATSVGDLRNLFLISIPGADEFTRLENLVLGRLPPEAANRWSAAKTAFASASGTSVEEVLSALGPELIAFSDRAGDLFGLHVRDQALLDSVLDRWAAAAEAPIASHRVGRATIRYWELPALFGMREHLGREVSPAIANIVSRLRNRLYWVEDGDYLYFAATPQVLIDRIDMGAETSIADWLAETQRVDMSSSLLAATGTTERLPRMMYNAYVGIMQTFADLVGAEYDIWAMPTANQLGLPDRGSVGLAVNLGEPYVSAELSYESHPFEALFGGGGMAAAAGIGVAAAIAIPAYQDYTIRAQVTEGLNLAAAPKAAVAESWNNTGQAPGGRTAAGMSADATDSQGKYVQSIDIVDGEIVIEYGKQANGAIAGKRLTLVPYAAADGTLAWRCGNAAMPAGAEPIGAETADGTTVMPKYLPSGCR